ncbi:transposase [Sphingobacterium prati]|uniref:transposase n=1 Tax=Sphingobacterium prati TaxID=2737006 RepID=UPI0039F41018
MIKVREKYDRAFKEPAVELSKSRKNIAELSRELGISAAQLYKWRKESEEFGSGSFPGNGNLKQTRQQERISLLEKKLKDSQLELAILKKAIAFPIWLLGNMFFISRNIHFPMSLMIGSDSLGRSSRIISGDNFSSLAFRSTL